MDPCAVSLDEFPAHTFPLSPVLSPILMPLSPLKSPTSPLSSGSSVETQKLRADATKLFKSGDTLGAAEMYRKALKGMSDDDNVNQETTCLSNLAACLLKIAPALSKEETRVSMLECVAMCTKALNLQPRHEKARWRRAKANCHLGHTRLYIADLRILVTNNPKKSEVTKHLAAEVHSETSPLDPVHEWLAKGDLFHRAQITLALLEPFYAQYDGVATVVYLLSSGSVAPTVFGLDILYASAEGFATQISGMGVVCTLLSDCLAHPCGRVVRVRALEVLHRIFDNLSNEAVIRFLQERDVWPSVAGLMSHADAPGDALTLASELAKRCDRELIAPYMEMLGIAASILWRLPDRALCNADLLSSLEPTKWDMVFKCMRGLRLITSIRTDLIKLTRFNDAIASSDAATLVGVIDDLLHPEDHCCMEDARPPLEGTPSCALCTKPHPELTCSFCLLAQYCSPECQRKDWDSHGRFCGGI